MNLKKLTLIKGILNQLILFLAAYWVVSMEGCAVEAGNPPSQTSTDKSKIQKFNLYIADAPIDEAVSLKLKFFKIEIIRENPDDFGIYSKNLEKPEVIDLLKLSDGKTQLLFGGDDVPVGDYTKILLHLDPDFPIFMETADGNKINLRVPPKGKDQPVNVFSIHEKFKVEPNKTADILVHFELRRSVKKTPLNDYVFLPHMQVIPEHIKASLNAKLSLKDPVLVCAYIRAPTLPPLPPPSVLKDEYGKPVIGVPAQAPQPPPPPQKKVEKDTTTECESADNAVRVKDSEVTFHHLHPLTYDFRVFLTDGTYQDFDAISFLPAEKKKVSW